MSYTESQIRDRRDRASQMLNDDLFAEMLTEVRMNALHELAAVKATDTDEIRRLQAIVAVADGIKDNLMACIIASGARDGGYSMTDEKDH